MFEEELTRASTVEDLVLKFTDRQLGRLFGWLSLGYGALLMIHRFLASESSLAERPDIFLPVVPYYVPLLIAIAPVMVLASKYADNVIARLAAGLACFLFTFYWGCWLMGLLVLAGTAFTDQLNLGRLFSQNKNADALESPKGYEITYDDQFREQLDNPNKEPAQSSRRQNLVQGEVSSHLIFEAVDDCLLTIDDRGRIVKANAAAHRLLDPSCIGVKIERYVPQINQEYLDEIASKERVRFDASVNPYSGSSLMSDISINTLITKGKWYGIVRITNYNSMHEKIAKLEQLALHDALTGLPNRVLLQDRAEQAIGIASRRNEPLAVMLLDLDRFKQVNDTLGHHVGDLLLQALGPRLTEPLRQTDTLARLGGDEFAILLPAPTSPEQAIEVAERLVESIYAPFMIEGMVLDIGVSIGISMFPDHGDDINGLLHKADIVMYKAKKDKMGYCLFKSGENYRHGGRVKLQQQLRTAIDNGDLEVLFQPKVKAGSWETTGVEALVRWSHPEHGVLPPSEFIPLAEQTGLILPLTLGVVNTCLEAQKSWRNSGYDLKVAVNVSPKWLQDSEFPRIIRLLLQNWHGDPEKITLEIPETGIMTDPSSTMKILQSLSDQGLDISLDDFGAGYSSLPMLQRLSINELKIDRRFIGDMTQDNNAAAVAKAICNLAHSLNFRVVAEGVETKQAALALEEIECDEMQGFLFSRPISANEIPNWIKNSGDIMPIEPKPKPVLVAYAET